MAEPVVVPRPMTFEDAAQLDPDQDRGEIVDGEWIPVSNNTWRHGEILLNIGFLLKAYARSNPGWSVAGGDPGTKLSHEPATLRGPDLGVIRAERRPTGTGVDGWLDGAPTLAVEVVGDTQSVAGVINKCLEYLTAGAQVVWVIDPASSKVLVLTPPNCIRVLGSEETLEGGDVLPGFKCRVAEIFE